MKRYRVPVSSLRFVREGSFAPMDCPGPWAAEGIAKEYLADHPVESLILMSTDARLRVRDIVLIARGSTGSLETHVGDILRPALLTGRPGFMLAHNHPSGDTSPSDADILLTRRVVEACAIVGLSMVDHVIVADGARFCSWETMPQRWGRNP